MPRFFDRKKRLDFYHLDIPSKANRILHVILIMMILIVIRIWHLSIVQHDQKLETSQKPQRKTLIIPAVRATIRDRFNLPLAVNKISYQATVLYSQIRDIPSIRWETDGEGKKIKVFKRKNYIRSLSRILGEELALDPERIEDSIHSKGSYYSRVPFVIKEDLTEKEYYKLKALEREWPGIHMRHLPKRYYPRGRVGADIVGYMGAINRPEYEKFLSEMKVLETFIKKMENGEEIDPPPGIATIGSARKRLENLEAKAYTIHDYVGKTGIEGVFEEQLRGFYGKKIFYSDSKGNFIRELPGSRAPLPGRRILSTISGELQEYAEALLAQNEELRLVRKSKLGPVKKTELAQKWPWIKGGAVVVMDPLNGDVLALASYPRFDPNDFISGGDREMQKEKQSRINRWFENESHLSQLWDQQYPMKRERYDLKEKKFYDEELRITWKTYLDLILPREGILHQTMSQIRRIKQAIDIQRKTELLMSYFPKYDLYTIFNTVYPEEFHIPHHPVMKSGEKENLLRMFEENRSEITRIKTRLKPYLAHIPQNYDKVLLIDLCRLIVCESKFSNDLIAETGNKTPEDYREQSGNFITIAAFVKEMISELYRDIDFRHWRRTEEREFLKKKRIEERTAGSYPKPYLDYLDRQEHLLFQRFWNANRSELIYTFLTGTRPASSEEKNLLEEDLDPYFAYMENWHRELSLGAYRSVSWKPAYDNLGKALDGLPPLTAIRYLNTFRSFHELNRPLLGSYRYLRKGNPQTEKNLASAFYPLYGYGYGRSHAYRQAAIQGSLFKLVTAYESLVQRYKTRENPAITFRDLNPLTMIDEVYRIGNVHYIGYTEDGKPIPQLYKGGRLPRSLAHKNNGKVDLIRALEVSSNPYFSLLAGECLEQPEDLSRAARLFSFGKRTGIDLPAEIPGKIPDDLATNRTGLYAMAIGQHSLVVTPLQTAVMLAAIANGGKVLKPKIVKLTAGRQLSNKDDKIVCNPVFPYRESLAIVGIDFPLFSNSSDNDQKSSVKNIPTEINRTLFMPEIIRQILLKGLWRASKRTQEESLASLTHLYRESPEAIRHFTELKDRLAGKTSTSESVENLDLDLEDGTNIYTHVWFGSIAFDTTYKDKNKTVLIFKDEFGQPELVIVVYLRYGGYGKEAAPIAAQLLKKWHEIKQKYAKSGF